MKPDDINPHSIAPASIPTEPPPIELVRPPEPEPPPSRSERLLEEIRDLIDATVRERTHKEFSYVWMAGGVAQVLVLGLLLLAALELIFDRLGTATFVKLEFAAVLQLVALTAFLLGRPDRK